MLLLFVKWQCKTFCRNGRLQQQSRANGATAFNAKQYCRKIKEYRSVRLNDLQFRALLGYERLAFGSIADCVQLLYMDKPTLQDLEGMDLFMISEIKRPKDGAMEIKFLTE